MKRIEKWTRDGCRGWVTRSGVGLVLWCAATLAPAQDIVPFRREVPLPAAVGEFAGFVPVVAPAGRCAAVSEVANVLAVAHKSGAASHLSIFSLDEKGELRSHEPKSVTLPLPEKLKGRKNYPLSVLAHPSLPLLYVWQDITAPGEKDALDNPDEDDFCHLLVFEIESETTELIQSVASGDGYARGNTAGAIAFDFHGKRLFLPNLKHTTAKGGATPAIGALRINEAGLADSEAEESVVGVTRSGKSEEAKEKGAVAAAARKAYLEAVKKGKLLSRQIRYASQMSATFAGYPCGLSFFPVSEQITLVGGPLGPVTWDEGNRRAQYNSLTIFPMVGVGYLLRLAGHPSLPVAYVTGLGSSWIYRFEHVEGFPTLLPQRGTLAGAKICSQPVVLPPRKWVACGGVDAVHLVGIDDEGMLNGQRQDIPVLCPSVEAMVYSKKFDRLYVAVDKVNP